MKIIVPVLFSVCTIIMTGCVSTPNDDPLSVDLDKERLNKALMSSASKVQKSIQVMEETNNAMAITQLSDDQIKFAKDQQRIVPYGMDRLMTYQGPMAKLDDMVGLIAGLAGYRVELVGDVKDVMVSVSATDMPIVEVLRRIGNQTNEAWVCPFPNGSHGSKMFNGVIVVNYSGTCADL